MLPPLRRLCTAAAGSLRAEAAVTPHIPGYATAGLFFGGAWLLIAAHCGAASLLSPQCADAGTAGELVRFINPVVFYKFDFTCTFP